MFRKSLYMWLDRARGLNVFVLVVGRMVNRMIQEIGQINMKTAGNIIYEVKDAQITQRSTTI